MENKARFLYLMTLDFIYKNMGNLVLHIENEKAMLRLFKCLQKNKMNNTFCFY